MKTTKYVQNWLCIVQYSTHVLRIVFLFICFFLYKYNFCLISYSADINLKVISGYFKISLRLH